MSSYEENEYQGLNGRPPAMDILLQGAGWDHPDGRDPYRELDPDLELDDELLQSALDQCRCSVDGIYSAASDLCTFLKGRPERFPRTDAQMETYSMPGGWAHGSWSRYVHYPSSIPRESGLDGAIHLFGCQLPGHSCRVVIDENDELSIQGHRTSTTDIHVSNPSIDIEVQAEISEAEEIREAIEVEEERRYDERTFGAIEDEVEDLEEDVHEVAVRDWQEQAFPSIEVDTFLSAGTEIDEVFQLGRYMPHPEVARWIEDFGPNAQLALELLRIGLGELRTVEELDNIDLDDLRSEIAEAIRETISRQLSRIENKLRIIEKKNAAESDEQIDIEDDLDF